MNTPKIGCHDLIQENLGRIDDQENWSTETAAWLQKQNLWPETERSSSRMVSRFESQASPVYAIGKNLGLPHLECQAGPGPSLFPPQQYSSTGSYFVDSGDQSAENFELIRTNRTILQPHQFHKSFDSTSGNKFHQFDQKPIISFDVGPGVGQLSVPSERNRDHKDTCNPYSSPPFAHPLFSVKDENDSPTFSFRTVVSASPPANHASVGTEFAKKTRIRWTQDLHEMFMECVNRLGGPEKATPKAILRLMDSEGLTIFHVKSHLQKYRIAACFPDTSHPTKLQTSDSSIICITGKEEKSTSINASSQIDGKIGVQIREALQMQMDAQRHLHDQLEIQRALQLRIEEQSRQLKNMFDHHQRTTNSHK